MMKTMNTVLGNMVIYAEVGYNQWICREAKDRLSYYFIKRFDNGDMFFNPLTGIRFRWCRTLENSKYMVADTRAYNGGYRTYVCTEIYETLEHMVKEVNCTWAR